MPFQNPRSPRARLLLAVALAHAALLLLMQAAGVWRDRQPQAPERDPLVVQLLAPPPVAAAPGAAPRAPAPPAARPAAPAPALRAAPEPEALQVPAAAALPAPSVQQEPPPRPLLLDLPRKASGPLAERHPGLDDPRANSARPTLESRIAGAVGSAEVTEEHLGDGRIRFRKGSGCVEVRPNAAGQLEPFNESARPSNRLATNC